MTMMVDVRPEVQAERAARACARGMEVASYAAALLEGRSASASRAVRENAGPRGEVLAQDSPWPHSGVRRPQMNADAQGKCPRIRVRQRPMIDLER